MMNTTKYTKEQINNAILEVITHQYKKDAKEAHRMVEGAGFSISKHNGAYCVNDKKTDKFVYARYNCDHDRLSIYNYNKTAKFNDGEVRFDFVNYFEKPINSVWNDLKYSFGRTNSTFKRWSNEMRNAKRNIDYCAERISVIQKQIAKLQDDLMSEAKYQAKEEERLRNLRKEITAKRRIA